MVITLKSSIINLEMSNSEDPMELSSDIDRRLLADEDIDLDLDFTSDQLHDKDDEFMAEDSTSLTGQTSYVDQVVQDGRDSDMIYDRFSPQDPQDPQDVEVLSSLQDEDLNDVEYNVLDDKLDVQQTSDFAFGLDNDNPKLLANRLQDQGQDGSVSTSYPQFSSHSDLPTSNEVQFLESPVKTTTTSNDDLEDSQDLGIANLQHKLSDTGHELSKAFHDQESLDIEGVAERNEPTWNATTHDDTSEPSLLPFAWDNEAASENDSDSQQEYSPENSTYLHPVMIVYQDLEMFLFPPVNQDQQDSQTYFLDDEKFATDNVMNLLGACRVVLAESIEEDQELQITFDELGLCISEVSPNVKTIPLDLDLNSSFFQSTAESSIVTLSQIIDLYVQLQQNDGIDNPEPLYLTLRTTTKFSYRFDYIIQTAAEGKGLSQLSLLERIKEESQYHELHRQQDLVEEIQPSDPNNSTFTVTNQDTLRNLKTKEDVVEQNPQTANTPLRAVDINSQQLDDISKLNPLLAASDTNEASTHDVEAPVMRTGFSQISKDVPEVLQDQESVRNPAEAPVSHVLHKTARSVIEGSDSISYDEIDEDPIQDSSTRSSTIQGDILEAVISSSDGSLQKPVLLARVENSNSAQNDLEQDHKSLLESQSFSSVSPPIANTKINKLVEEGLSEALREEPGQPVESENLKLLAAASTEDLYKHQPDSAVVQKSSATQVSSSLTIEADNSDNSAPQYKKASPDTPDTPYAGKEYGRSSEFLAQDLNLPKPDRLGTNGHVHKLRIAKDTDGENAPYLNAHEKYASCSSESAQLSEIDGNFTENDKNIEHSKLELIAENQPFIESPIGLLTDADEITYDDDEPLDTPILRNTRSSPVSLKRTRGYHEDDILHVGDSQGKF